MQLRLSMSIAKTVYGLVSPYEWDGNGNPLRVKICSRGEIDYYVVDNDRGIMLLQYVRKWVTASGSISRIGGLNIIDLEDFKIQNIGGDL